MALFGMWLKTQLIWWLSDRWRWRRRCAGLSKANKDLRRELQELRERLYVANRDRLEAEGRLQQAHQMWVEEGVKWREQLDRVIVWLGRVATGFGPGDQVPTRELVAADTVSTGKLHPQDAFLAMIKKAQHGRNT